MPLSNQECVYAETGRFIILSPPSFHKRPLSLSLSLSQKHRIREIRLRSPHFIRAVISVRSLLREDLASLDASAAVPSLEWRHYVIPSPSLSLSL